MLHFPAPVPSSSSSSSFSYICKIHLWHTFCLQRGARIDGGHYGSTNARFRMSDVRTALPVVVLNGKARRLPEPQPSWPPCQNNGIECLNLIMSMCVCACAHLICVRARTCTRCSLDLIFFFFFFNGWCVWHTHPNTHMRSSWQRLDGANNRRASLARIQESQSSLYIPSEFMFLAFKT